MFAGCPPRGVRCRGLTCESQEESSRLSHPQPPYPASACSKLDVTALPLNFRAVSP